MTTIERDGARISYTDEGTGPAVVLGHSLLCDGRMWTPVLPALREGRRILNVDFRGHGGSTAPRGFTLEDLALDWLAILDREGIDRAVLCGLSMGGMTALRLALRAPDRVAGLILLDTSAGPQPLVEQVRYRAMAEVLRYVGFARVLFPAVRRAMFGRTSLGERQALVAEQEARIREHDPRQLYHAVRAVLERSSVRAALPRIDVPALVVVGEEDGATPPANARTLADGLPQARLETVPRAGHLSVIEAPDRVGPLLVGFLDELGWGEHAAA